MAKNKNNLAGIFLLAMVVVLSACGGGDDTRTPEEIAIATEKWRTTLMWAWGITAFWLIGAIIQWSAGRSDTAIKHGWHFSDEVDSLKWRICPPVFWCCLAISVVLSFIYSICY